MSVTFSLQNITEISKKWQKWQKSLETYVSKSDYSVYEMELAPPFFEHCHIKWIKYCLQTNFKNFKSVNFSRKKMDQSYQPIHDDVSLLFDFSPHFIFIKFIYDKIHIYIKIWLKYMWCVLGCVFWNWNFFKGF